MPKRQPVVVPDELARQLVPFQELETAWLVETPSGVADRLAAAGLSAERIDAAPAGGPYYLVFTPSRARCDALAASGRSWWVDEGLCLFAPAGGQARDLVPADISIKEVSRPIEASIRFTTGARATPRAAAAAQGLASPAITTLAANVDPERLIAIVAALESFGTRYASTSACEAAGTWIGTWFKAIGLSTSFEYFGFGTSSTTTYTTSNVIATLPGRVDPSQIVIVSAHYDSYSDQRQTLAPGADDNASGTALVLELARILKDQPFDFTVKFVAWGAEEWGLNGSRFHARQALQRGDQVVASVVADMVGYADATPEDLEIVSNEASQWLAARYAAAAATYGGLSGVRQVRTQFGSDCTSFWEQGFASACSIEDYPLRNPYYHLTSDRYQTLNTAFLAASTRATLALVAELAQPVSTPAPPVGLEAATQISRSLFRTSLFRRARTVVLTWEPSRDTVAGYHVYRATSPHGEYRRLTSTPVAATLYLDQWLDSTATFFYVVRSVDSAGRESNPTGEASADGYSIGR